MWIGYIQMNWVYSDGSDIFRWIKYMKGATESFFTEVSYCKKRQGLGPQYIQMDQVNPEESGIYSDREGMFRWIRDI